MSNWHNELLDGEGWFAELRARKVRDKQICGTCGEWPEYCDCGTLNQLQAASVDEHGVPIPAVMQVIINRLAPESGKIEEVSPFAGMPLCSHNIQFDCEQCNFEKEKVRPGQCQYCGTRTGQHGFSFDMER